MSVAALTVSGVPEVQLERSIAAFSVTELSGEPTFRVPQAVPEVVNADEKVSAPPEAIVVLVPLAPDCNRARRSSTFKVPAEPAEIALYELVAESHQRFEVADELTVTEDVVQGE